MGHQTSDASMSCLKAGLAPEELNVGKLEDYFIKLSSCPRRTRAPLFSARALKTFLFSSSSLTDGLTVVSQDSLQ